jgi:hypothetical protein
MTVCLDTRPAPASEQCPAAPIRTFVGPGLVSGVRDALNPNGASGAGDKLPRPAAAP